MACIACCGAQSKAARPPARSAKPDIFLVTIDTLRADHVHCYGYDGVQTPALDSLAQDGTRFSNAFTPSPITNTSHTSILTGLLPSSHGVTDFAIPLAPAHATWAEILKQQGYKTAAFIGAVILDSKTLAPGLDRGFDFYDNFPEHPESKSRWGRVERRGMEVVQHAETWLTQHRTGPHFMWMHLYDPHDPYEPPAPFSQTYKDRLYDGEIAYADSALGHFIAYLKKQGIYEASLIIVVGDHGEGLGEHREETHGIFLYDATTHVPLLVKLPSRVPQKKVVDAQVRTTDILPTALDLVAAPVPQELDGQSLKAYLNGSVASDRTAIGETDYPLRFGWSPLRSVRERGSKYIEAPRPELYNLQADPKELHNIYSADEATVQKLRKELVDVSAKSPDGAKDANARLSLPDPKDRIEEQNLLHSAMLASEDNQPEQARAALERVIAMDPKSPTALQQLGQLEFSAKNYQKAAGYLKQALEVRPDDAASAYSLGQALQLSGNLPGARDALETSLKINPSQFPARLLLGRVELRMNDLSAAEDQLEAALLLEPQNAEATIVLAEVLVAQKKFTDAAAQLEPLARTHPSRELYETLSKAYAGEGKTEAAQKAQARAKA
ncbi:MAG TPA: sulfatase-like hydrolase/transferase, partial [Terriglobales bacterium]|nr:sulfatase-like hydrolase/transferase [Terriglobales bacterium]